MNLEIRLEFPEIYSCKTAQLLISSIGSFEILLFVYLLYLFCIPILALAAAKIYLNNLSCLFESI